MQNGSSECDRALMKAWYKYDVVSAKTSHLAAGMVVKEIPRFRDHVLGPPGKDLLEGSLLHAASWSVLCRGSRRCMRNIQYQVHRNVEFFEQEVRLRSEPIVDFSLGDESGERERLVLNAPVLVVMAEGKRNLQPSPAISWARVDIVKMVHPFGDKAKKGNDNDDKGITTRAG
ncbi:uncharacterized protein BT62DRAFT_1079702 [Guyanagaster necrorhizus]|uniref:Uncharacterized protein n=1 Tax=Guyanagaster necrorhizus TaxID=856835 RepID=A0A9P7VL77_9AGAR|nr:uncharacterized protein BT62DRAFT_1079702 [Guyanagaster necrorhizus MCA 3950]KAG7441959.1 hypothetical protein BT62DRAFT_1079702 [Guyanagaster necrorhizus MCA 3950]